MGKRKSRAKPAPRKRMRKLETVFCCPFCNRGDSVECTIDLTIKIGEATCAICKESYSTTANALTEPIDIKYPNEEPTMHTNDASIDKMNKEESSSHNIFGEDRSSSC